MKKIILFFFLFGFAIPVLSQEGFEFVKTKSDRVRVAAKTINNLVFIPVEVNGVSLLFLLDSGVEDTIVFGFQDPEKINLQHVEKIKIRGLGEDDGVDAYKSSGNVLTIGGLQSRNHSLYLITDPSFDLSSFVGITVNGIIGYTAFINHLVSIDYGNKQVVFYKHNSNFHKKIQKEYTKVPLLVERQKPYVNALVKVDTVEVLAKLLVDTGNSDAVWLFDRLSDKINVPKKHFDDYLGQGLSGAVEGKRGRIAEFSIADFKFDSPIVAFPDSASIKNISLNTNRLGSLGGEILKRFSVVFDYDGQQLFLKKNKSYKASFYYNKSGIEIWRSGVQWVKQLVVIQDNSIVIDRGKDNPEKNGANFSYKMELKPVYEIGYIRESSNAAKSGLKTGDILVAIDGKEVYNYSLQDINSLLWSEDEIWIELRILREGNLMNFKFQLVNIL
ncbi:signal protein PDZ [Flavobacterium sufflavum]|uniref:Signal protein PDZ n=1 Tax=Flavobacterium sufflavum TaxID=1921138 RepID=A0A3S2XHY0_9FLAO|nr:aspartyl protease family protein [Flavobacterium sufflavum]RVT75923.1 signal protein PDZ [Flavobacterium sufflavum]